MRKTALVAGLVLCLSILGTTTLPAHAESVRLAVNNTSTIEEGQKAVNVVGAYVAQQEKPAEKKPVEHVVASGETLTSIANQHQTSWQRLYAKNVQLANPDVIDVGQKLVIPEANEQLPERTAPVQAEGPTENTAQTVAAPRKSPAQPAVTHGSSSDNTYERGYCTWYAKNRRPDLPNNLGNAATWVARAQAQGLATGSAPRTGAIGQHGNHVVYVESVNGDGTVAISEMNHAGWNVVSSRSVPASYFSYIY